MRKPYEYDPATKKLTFKGIAASLDYGSSSSCDLVFTVSDDMKSLTFSEMAIFAPANPYTCAFFNSAVTLSAK